MNIISVGIIGTGFIGIAHIEALRRLGFVHIAAIAGSNLASSRAAAEALGIPRAYGDYREMLLDSHITVVHNCTPNHLHYGMNKDIIRAGKHILSEKPLAVTSTESEELLQLAQSAGIVHGVNFNYRQFPIIKQLAHMVSSDELGHINLIHGSYLQDWLAKETDYNWRMNRATGGPSRAVADIGSHWCDTIQYVTGKQIAEVCADLATVIPIRKKPSEHRVPTYQHTAEDIKDIEYEDVAIDTEDYASVLIRFTDGSRGTFTVSQVSHGRKNRLSFELNGSAKSASWNQEEPEKLWIGYRDKANEMLLADTTLFAPEARASIHYPGGHNEGWPDALKNMMLQFYTYIRDGKTPGKDTADFVTFIEGHRSLLISEAILESHSRGCWIRVPHPSQAKVINNERSRNY